MDNKHNRLSFCLYYDYTKSSNFFDNFNEPLNDDIMKYLQVSKSIVFGRKFNQLVDNLSSGIKSIEFGEKFNQPIDNLPDTIEEILFGDRFNQSIDFLPKNLKKLLFSQCSIFNQPMNNLPQSLKIISLSHNYNQNIDNLPDSVETIRIGVDRFEKSYYYADTNAKFNHVINKLPKSLLEIYILDTYPYLEQLKQKIPNFEYIENRANYFHEERNVCIIKLFRI